MLGQISGLDVFFEGAVAVVEALGVILLLAGVLAAVFKHMFVWVRTHSHEKVERFSSFRQDLGRTMLLSLEFFVAADILALVAVDQTLGNLLELLLVVFIRTFLSVTLELELTGSWPWQKRAEETPD